MAQSLPFERYQGPRPATGVPALGPQSVAGSSTATGLTRRGFYSNQCGWQAPTTATGGPLPLHQQQPGAGTHSSAPRFYGVLRRGQCPRMVVAMARPRNGSSGLQQPAVPAATSASQQRRRPSSQAPLSTDLLIQSLEAATDTQSVLELVKQPRASAAEPVFLYTAALKALARLLARPAASGAAGLGRGGQQRSKEELQELQAVVRSMVSEMHTRVFSFPLLSDTLISLDVLLPALGSWQVAGLRADDAALRLLAMATDVPQAAADADALRPVPLPALRDAFRAALRLTQMAQQMQQAPSPQVESTARRVREAVQTYLRRAVFPAAEEGGQAAAAARLHGADLAAMAAAAELAVMWDVEVPPEVMQLHVRHVDRLLSGAAGPAYIVSADVHAEQHSVAGQGTSRSGDDNTSTSHHAQGRGNGRAEPRGRGGRGGGGRVGRGSSASQQGRGAAGVSGTASDRTEPPLPDGLVAAGQLDVTSLAQLLIAWASVPAGRPAPSVEWLDRASALALRTQDRLTAGKRSQLLRRLNRLHVKQQKAEQRLQQLQEAAGAQGPAGVQQEMLVDDGGEEEEDEEGELEYSDPERSAFEDEERKVLPESIPTFTATLERIGQEVRSCEQALAALGPVAIAPSAAGSGVAAAPAPPAPDSKKRQQANTAAAIMPGAPTAHVASKRARSGKQQQPLARAAEEGAPAAGTQPSYALASGALTGLLWAVSEKLGDKLVSETRALARAVAVARMSDFTSPQQIVAVLYSLGRMKSVPAREEVGKVIKRLRPHLESLSPTDAVRLLQALEALDYNPPAKPWQAQPQAQPQASSQPTRTGKAGKADTAQPAADAGFSPSGAKIIGRLMVMVGGLGSRGGGGGGQARGLAAAPSDLILQLLRSCAAWSVPFPEAHLGALEDIVEQRVLRSLPLDKIKLLSPRAMATAAQASYGYVPTAVASDADVNADVMRAGLLDGVILPLAATRQGFANGDMFYLALWDWMEVKACEGITVDKATSLINSYAYNKSWALVPQLRKVMEGLMERALQLPVSQPREGSKLLLAVGRALRVMGDKMQCTPADSIADKVAPGVAPLLLPAVQQLLRLRPSMSDISAVAKGLLVEARWRVPVSADGFGRSTSGGEPGHRAILLEQATRGLLVDLLAAAMSEPKPLEEMGVSEVAWLLEGFAALQYRPSHDTLAQLYSAAAARLVERPAKAEEVVELLNSVTGMDRVASEPAAANAAAGPMAAGGSAPATGRRGALGDELKARGRLLQQLAVAVLQEPALPVLAAQPGGLVAAIRQMAALGLRPPTQQWLSTYTTVLQDLLPKLQATSLAHGAEGLALLGAAPPSSFLDILLTCADKHGVDRFEPHALGLLLGGAHALRQNALAAQAAAELRLRGVGDDDEAEEERAHTAEAADVDPAAWRRRQVATGVPVVAPLSTAAQETWGRAHVAFVSEARKSNPMPRYSRAQQLLVVSAVTSFELSRPPLSQGQQAAAGSGVGKAGRGSSKAAGAGAVADFRARLEADWLAETCASLLASRRALEASAVGGSGGSASLLPSPELLEDLLRLASRVLRGCDDGSIVRLASSPTASASSSAVDSSTATAGLDAAESVLQLVQLSIRDLFQSSSSQREATALTAWRRLLCAALAAGISLSPAELGVFASALLDEAAKRTRRALAAKGSGSTARAAAAVVHTAASAGSGAGSRSLSAEGRELMTAVWQDVEEGLEGVLLPVLPWVPPHEILKALRFGLLEQPPAVLTAASLRQLALMCTYTTQAAPQLAEEAGRGRRTLWWSTVRAELLRRAQDEEVEKAWSKAQRGSGSNGSATTAEADLQTAIDLAAACYGLLMHGGGSREGRDSASGGGAAPSSASLPDELATWMKLLLTRAGSSLAARTSLSKGLAGVRALQLLWVARSAGCAHLLPASVWSTAFGALGPEKTGAAALQPRQLAQLVVLRAEALRGSGDSATGNGPLERLPTRARSSMPVASWFLEVWLGRLAVSCRRVLLSKRARGGASADSDGVTPAVAFLAVAYCLPPDQQRPPEYAAVLAKAALPALSGSVGTAAGADVTLRLADLWAFLRRVEGWPVTGSGSSTGDSSGNQNGSDASWFGLPVEAAAAVCQQVLAVAQTGAQAAGGFIMPPSEAVQFTVTLLNATAVESSSASALEAALPLLQALVPEAEAELWALATRERLGRAVLASALQAALNAVTNTEPPLGADGAIASACEVAALMVGSVAVLLQQLPQQPTAAQVANSRAASVVSRLDARSLPPDQLAALASAIIRLCPPAAGGAAAGDDAAARIPQAAAAVLLRLMSAAEVVERLPITRLEAALTRFLPAQQQQHEGQAPEAGSQLPMTEAVAQAISAKLQVGSTAWFARTPVGLAVQLHRCGASGVLLQRALLADRDWAGREVQLLQALAMAAPREPLALSLRDYGPERTVEESDAIAQPGEGPFGQLVLKLCRGLERVQRLSDAAACMTSLAEVVPYLEGTKGSDGLFALYNTVKLLPVCVAQQPAQLAKDIHVDPEHLWRLLEAMLKLGGEHHNDCMFHTARRKFVQTNGFMLPYTHPLDTALDNRRFAVQREEFDFCGTFVGYVGPYLIHPKVGQVILECAKPLVGRHQQRMEQLLQEQSAANHPGSTSTSSSSTAGGAAAAAYWWPPGCAQPPPGRLVAGLRLPEGDPDLLSARQLGLLYGAVVIHGQDAESPLPYGIIETEGVQQLYLAYITSLNLLAGRTDLLPHEHLEAMLGALEPAVFGDRRIVPAGPDGMEPVEGYDFYNDCLPIERFLAPVLARYAKLGAEEQPQPAGADRRVDTVDLFGLADLSDQSMLVSLYRKRPVPEEDGRGATTAPGGGGGSGSRRGLGGGGGPEVLDVGPGLDVGAAAQASRAERGDGGTSGAVTGAWAGKPRPIARPAHHDWIHLYVPSLELPAHLRLPPGHRHGQPGGDPAADAAREAYVRSIVPSFGLLRRLARMVAVTRRTDEVRRALQEDSGFSGFGEGRWARLLEYILDGEGAQKRATAEELLKMLGVQWADAHQQDTSSSSSSSSSSEPSNGSWNRMMAREKSVPPAGGDAASETPLAPEANPAAAQQDVAAGKAKGGSAPAASQVQTDMARAVDQAAGAPPGSSLTLPELAGSCSTERTPTRQQTPPVQQAQLQPQPQPQDPAAAGDQGMELLGAVAQVGSALGSMLVGAAQAAVQSAVSSVASAVAASSIGELDPAQAAVQAEAQQYLEVMLWAHIAVKGCAVELNEGTRQLMLHRAVRKLMLAQSSKSTNSDGRMQLDRDELVRAFVAEADEYAIESRRQKRKAAKRRGFGKS